MTRVQQELRPVTRAILYSASSWVKRAHQGLSVTQGFLNLGGSSFLRREHPKMAQGFPVWFPLKYPLQLQTTTNPFKLMKCSIQFCAGDVRKEEDVAS